MAKNLTEKQALFLQVLFDGAKGDTLIAKKMAGYSDNVPVSVVVAPLAEEISDLTKKFIARSATKAAYAMFDVIETPSAFGNKEKMAAAKDILDRAGFAKTEKVEVTTSSPLFILPAKGEE